MCYTIYGNCYDTCMANYYLLSKPANFHSKLKVAVNSSFSANILGIRLWFVAKPSRKCIGRVTQTKHKVSFDGCRAAPILFTFGMSSSKIGNVVIQSVQYFAPIMVMLLY